MVQLYSIKRKDEVVKKDRTCWRRGIEYAMGLHGEGWGDIVSSATPLPALDRMFDSGYGGSEGEPFTVWTHGRVYFPLVYDGAEWVGSVSRSPDGKATKHFGDQ